MTSSAKSWGVGLIFVPVALLLGLILGGMAPRRELDKARTEIERLKSQGGSRGGNSLNMITDVVRIPTDATTRNIEQPPEPLDTGEREVGEDDESIPAATPPADEPSPPAGPTGLAEQLAAAREAWKIRSDIARNSFLSRTGLRENAVVDFDVIIAAMNLRLRSSFEDLARTLAAGEDLTTERGVRMINNLTGVLALTYDELDRKLPTTWRAAGGDDFDLTDFIDPSVAEPLIPVGHKLEDRHRRRNR